MKRLPFPEIIIAIGLSSLGGSCANRTSNPVSTRRPAVPTQSTPAPRQTATADSNSVPEIARREVIRRQEQIRRMDEAAIRASARMAEDDLEGAVEGYRRAMGNR